MTSKITSSRFFNYIRKKIASSLLLLTAIKSLLLKFSGAGINFLSGIFIARILGDSDFGVYSLVVSLVTLLGLLASFGLSTYYTRESAIFISEKKYLAIKYLLTRADRMTVSVSVVLLISGFLLIEFRMIGVDWKSMSALTWFLLGCIVPVISFNFVRSSILRGVGKVILADFPDVLLKPVFVVTLLSIGYLLEFQFNSSSVVLLQIVGFLLSFSVLTYLIKKFLVVVPKIKQRIEINRIPHKTIFIFFMISFSTTLQAQLPFYLTGYFLASAYAGYYQACLILVNVLSLGLTAINSPIQPRIASAWARNEKENVQRIIAESVRIACVVSLFFFVIIYFTSSSILMMFGPGFIKAATALNVLLFGQLVNALCGPCVMLLIMTKNQTIVLVVMLFSIFFGCILGVWLVPSYGIVGASFLSVAIMLFWNVIMTVYCYRKLAINTSIFYGLFGANIIRDRSS